MKNLLCILTLLCALALSALAQNKPKPNAAKKPKADNSIVRVDSPGAVAVTGNGNVVNRDTPGQTIIESGPTGVSLPPGTRAVGTVKAEKPTLPASVEFTKEQWESIEAKRKDARLALLEADNLRLNLEKAQAEYSKLSDTARKSQAAYSDLLYATTEKLGIPKEELPNYEFSDADGKFTLKRKTDLKAETKKAN